MFIAIPVFTSSQSTNTKTTYEREIVLQNQAMCFRFPVTDDYQFRRAAPSLLLALCKFPVARLSRAIGVFAASCARTKALRVFVHNLYESTMSLPPRISAELVGVSRSQCATWSGFFQRHRISG